jgi:hypothetical protein
VKQRLRGNCYVATEALFHILGGREAGWKAMRLTCTTYGHGHVATNPETHWFLKHDSGIIVDPSVRQFRRPGWWDAPDYTKARGSGFLTKRPSRRARALIKRLTWT